MSGTTETLSNVVFADGETLSGTFTAVLDPTTGAPQSISNFNFTVDVGGTIVTLSNSDATATVQTASKTASGTPLYQIYINVTNATTQNTVHNVYLDFTESGTSLYVAKAPAQGGIESRYTSISDSSSNFSAVTLASTGGGTLTPTVPCFMAGTQILTQDGEVAVEALTQGTLVMIADGAALPVRWLGRSSVSTRFGDKLRVLPIRIKAGALGENSPVRDLLVSPDHALLVGDILINAAALVNGTSILREEYVPETFTYYHVELASHAMLLADGAPAESFVDNVDRMNFDNWAEHEALGEVAPIEELPYPRAKSYRQVPLAIRQILARNAAPYTDNAAA